jgi:hypothetical protein
MLEDLIDEARRRGLRVNNLFEPGAGAWPASITDGERRYGLAAGSTPDEALRGALDHATAMAAVDVTGVPRQKSSVALSLAPMVKAADARGTDLAIALAPLGLASGTATIGSFAALASAPTGVALGAPGVRRSVTSAATPALQIAGAPALAAKTVAACAPALAAAAASSVASAIDLASMPSLMVGTGTAMVLLFDDGTQWNDGTFWIDD